MQLPLVHAKQVNNYTSSPRDCAILPIKLSFYAVHYTEHRHYLQINGRKRRMNRTEKNMSPSMRLVTDQEYIREVNIDVHRSRVYKRNKYQCTLASEFRYSSSSLLFDSIVSVFSLLMISDLAIQT